MLPVLFTFGNLPISSLGVSLILAILVCTYFIWRVIRVYELNEEQVIDLILITVAGGLLGARTYFYFTHLNQFSEPLQFILFNKYPGLSFWGGLMGGILALKIGTLRIKFNFYQIMDFAMAVLFVGIAISSVGCLLSSCQYGFISSGPFSVTQIGILNKRFPLQIIESIIMLILFMKLFKSALRFHFMGQIAAKGFIFLGISKLILEFFRGDKQLIFVGFSTGLIYSILLIMLGTYVYYAQSKRSFKRDLKMIVSLPINPKQQRVLVYKLKKSWYNQKVNFKLGVLFWVRKITKLLNIKSNPTKF